MESRWENEILVRISDVFRAPQADLDLWPGLGTRGLGLAAASTPCLGLLEAAFNSSVPTSVCRTVFLPVLHFVHPITAKSAPFSGWGTPADLAWVDCTWFFTLVWFREVAAVVLQFFPVVGSRYFWVGFFFEVTQNFSVLRLWIDRHLL